MMGGLPQRGLGERARGVRGGGRPDHLIKTWKAVAASEAFDAFRIPLFSLPPSPAQLRRYCSPQGESDIMAPSPSFSAPSPSRAVMPISQPSRENPTWPATCTSAP